MSDGVASQAPADPARCSRALKAFPSNGATGGLSLREKEGTDWRDLGIQSLVSVHLLSEMQTIPDLPMTPMPSAWSSQSCSPQRVIAGDLGGAQDFGTKQHSDLEREQCGSLLPYSCRNSGLELGFLEKCCILPFPTLAND